MMEAQQFAYWLQGFAELNDAPPSEAQWQSIRDHLSLVFNKITPAVEVKEGPRVNIPMPWLPSTAVMSDGTARTYC